MPRASKSTEKTAAPAKKAPAKADAKSLDAKSLDAKSQVAKSPVAKPSAKDTRDGAKKVPAKKSAAATEPPAAAAPAKKAGSADKFVEAQRLQLLDERASYNRQASSLRAEAEQLAADREPGDVQFDEESGEGDTLNVERERDLALSAQAMGSVDEIDKALAKIEAGTYGTCEKCGEPIPRERLRALPHAALCVRCKSMGLSRR